MESPCHYSATILNASMESLRQFFFSLYQLEDSVVGRLGRRSYLMNEYHFILLTAVNPYSHEAAEAGYAAADELSRLCYDIEQGEVSCCSHPLYETAKSCLSLSPLHQDERTSAYLYPDLLAGEFLRFASERFFTEIFRPPHNSYHVQDDSCLARRICNLLKEESTLEQMKELCQQQFVPITTLAAFLHGLTSRLQNTPSLEDEAYCYELFWRITHKSASFVTPLIL